MHVEYDEYADGYLFCPACKTVFCESAVKQIVYPATRDVPEERVCVCPGCGNEDGDLEETYQCAFCGQWRGWEQLRIIDDMCNECYADGVKRLRAAANGIETEEHDRAPLAVLRYLLEGD